MKFKIACMLGLLACCSLMPAQDYGDAPASYGLMQADFGQGGLGVNWNDDLSNPVTPAWTGDNDDCVVGTPLWDSWSSFNTLTVKITSPGHLILWVDADDNGQWTASERYEFFPQVLLSQPGDYTFTGINIKRTQDFSRNAHNKCAVRVVLQENMGGPPNPNPTGSFYFGEVEDWLIDVEPAKFVVANEVYRNLNEGVPTSYFISAQNGTPPYTWSMLGGSLPAGITLTQSGDLFNISGTPGPGSGAGVVDYSFTVQVTDTASLIAQRQLVLRVLPPAATLPFSDDFSTNKGWVLGATWSRGPATAFTATGQSWDGWPATEPALDASAGTDNMILGDSIGTPRPDLMPQPKWAISPVLNCTGINEVELRFSRWLSCGRFDVERARVQVTNDGISWTDVWSNDFGYGWNNLCDFSWTPFTYDISAVAGNMPRVQVRIGMGQCDYPLWLTLAGVYERFAGWCIDDFSVREKPMANVLVAQSFSVATTGSFFDPITATTLPMLYPQNTHAFTAIVSNNSTSNVSITGFEVGVVQVGLSQFYGTQSSWINIGAFSLAMPVVVPAGATGFSVQGSLLAGFVPSQLALLPMDATIFFNGTDAATGKPVRALAAFRFGMNAFVQAGLRVYEIQVGGTPVFNGDAPAGLRDFGSVITGQSGNWLNIVLKNTSSTAVNLAQATLTGPDAGQFQLSNAGYLSPIVNQTGVFSYFSLRFRPTTPGFKTVTVSFTHDATNTGTPFTFQIRGFGVANAPVLQVTETNASGPGIAYAAAAANGRDFGNQDISAGATATLIVRIENTGTQTLVLGAPLLSGIDAAAFGIDVSAFMTSVAAGNGTQFGLYFDPATTGPRQAQVSFAHNGAGVTTPFIFDIAGAGIINAPLIQVTEASGAPVGPGSVATGGRQLGVQDVSSGATAALSIVIRNNGWQNLVVGTPVMTGVHPADFVLNLTGMLFTLGHNQSTSFTVAFDPISKGLKNALVSLTHNDTAAPSPYAFAVSGLGTDPNGVVILTATLALGQATKTYGPVALQAGGGTNPYTWTQAGGVLPTGIILAQDGTLSGTPSVDGAFSWRARVTDSLGGVEEKQLQIIIQPAPGALSKDSSAVGGSCTTVGEGSAAFLLLMLLALGSLAIRTRRVGTLISTVHEETPHRSAQSLRTVNCIWKMR